MYHTKISNAKHIVWRMIECIKPHIADRPNIILENEPNLCFENKVRDRLYITGTLFRIKCKSSSDYDIGLAMSDYLCFLQDLESEIFQVATSYYGYRNVNISEVFDPSRDKDSEGNCYVRVRYSIY